MFSFFRSKWGELAILVAIGLAWIFSAAYLL